MMGSAQGLKLLGVTLIGATPENLRKLVLTFAFIAAAWIVTIVLRALLRLFIGTRAGMQTTIMEMGQSPKEQADAPSMWIRSRQFTGRIVTVTNDKVFDEPVYNYTHDFPYIWDEINLPVSYRDDRGRAEEILLEAASRHALTGEKIGEEEVKRLEEKFGIDVGEIEPRVYWRITDNWLELTVRFLVPDHGGRRIKDAMNREILVKLDAAKIDIASATYDVVGMPPLKVQLAGEGA